MHPQSTLPTSPRVCAFDGCGRPHDSRGYCKQHAAQVRAGRPLALLNPENVRRACGCCGSSFQQLRPWHKYCSSECQHAEEFRRERERQRLRRGPAQVRKRFEERDCGYATPCWVWLGTITPQGYGALYAGRKQGRDQHQRAHRAYYEMARGQVPPGMQLDHLCRNRACVRPGHLEPVTAAENQHRRPDLQRIRTLVHEIRASQEPPCVIARRLGLRRGRIWTIRTRRAWQDV